MTLKALEMLFLDERKALELRCCVWGMPGLPGLECFLLGAEGLRKKRCTWVKCSARMIE